MAKLVTDEDVAAELKEVVALREELATAEATRVERERSQSNAIQLGQLRAEKERLKLAVARAKSAATVSSVNEGVAAPLAASQEAMQAAVAAQKEDNKLAKAENATPASAATTREGS